MKEQYKFKKSLNNAVFESKISSNDHEFWEKVIQSKRKLEKNIKQEKKNNIYFKVLSGHCVSRNRMQVQSDGALSLVVMMCGYFLVVTPFLYVS